MNGFDLLSLIIVLALLFTIGLHAHPKEERIFVTVAVSLSTKEERGAPENETNAAVDKRYEISSLTKTADGYTMIASALYKNGGYLLSGQKYLCLNQKIEIFGENSYLFAKITEITPVK